MEDEVSAALEPRPSSAGRHKLTKFDGIRSERPFAIEAFPYVQTKAGDHC